MSATRTTRGYWLDRDTGLYLCQARWYDPVTARWVTRDPIGYAGGANLYGYCGGGPVGWANPSGLLQVNAWTIFAVAPALGSIALYFGGGDFEFTGESMGQGIEVSGASAAVVVTNTLAEIGNGAFQGPSSMFFDGPFTGWDGGNYKYDAGFAESTDCWDVAQYAGLAATGSGASGLMAKAGIHGPHHTFGKLGKLPHIQFTFWRRGVKGSDKHLRIPLPRWWRWL